MIDFSKVRWFKQPEGTVVTMTDSIGKVLWRAPVPQTYPINYVSLGDSIAAGHTIDSNWEKRYGTGSQFGVNGNTKTTIVPGCYTDILHKHMVAIYGAENVKATSFARSGERVQDMIPKLDNVYVRDALAKAHIVTICIGANDVLEPAMSNLGEYINTGSLATIQQEVEANLANLADDSSSTSYRALFDKLHEINPTARYTFMTVYNPYKYLWLEEGRNGFFAPLLNTIPEMNIDVDKVIEDMFLGGKDLAYFDILKWKWVAIELEIDVDGMIKDGLLNIPIVQQLFDRVNGLCDWSEQFVTRLNTVMKEAVARYQASHNSHFSVVEAKAAFDLFPDRQGSDSVVEYNDLVNVEYTRGYNTATMDWGSLWRDQYGDNVEQYWQDLAWKHLHFQNSEPWVNFDLAGLAADLVTQMISKVITPDVDPHPEHGGQQVLARAFGNGIGLIRYHGDKSTFEIGGAAQAGETATLPTPQRWGHNFGGWYTDAALTAENDQSRTDYAENKTLALSDLDGGGYVISKAPKTTQLYAKMAEIEV